MRTDRELLELAAKAAGIGGSWDWLRGESKPCCYRGSDGRIWSPLTDDGDALRVAVRLGICIKFIPSCDTVQVYQEREFTAEPFNGHADDLCDMGTRRAIVRAAAEIGARMP